MGFFISDFILNFIFCLCYQYLGVNTTSQGCQGPAFCFLWLHHLLDLSVERWPLHLLVWNILSWAEEVSDNVEGRAPRLGEKTFPKNLYRDVRHENTVWLLSGGENGIFKPGSLLPPKKSEFYCYIMKGGLPSLLSG